MTSWIGLKKKPIGKGGERWGLLFYFLWNKTFDEVSLYLIRNFLALQRAVFHYFMTLFSDAGRDLDLRINLESA